MTIQQIKEQTRETEPFFFTKDSLKFFGQTMKSFKVKKQYDGRYQVTAPIKSCGKVVSKTEVYFNPANKKLELN